MRNLVLNYILSCMISIKHNIKVNEQGVFSFLITSLILNSHVVTGVRGFRNYSQQTLQGI